jgi:hypothetical protein
VRYAYLERQSLRMPGHQSQMYESTTFLLQWLLNTPSSTFQKLTCHTKHRNFLWRKALSPPTCDYWRSTIGTGMPVLSSTIRHLSKTFQKLTLTLWFGRALNNSIDLDSPRLWNAPYLNVPMGNSSWITNAMTAIWSCCCCWYYYFFLLLMKI